MTPGHLDFRVDRVQSSECIVRTPNPSRRSEDQNVTGPLGTAQDDNHRTALHAASDLGLDSNQMLNLG